MANVYPDQEIDPLWCNTGAALASGGEVPLLPCGNSTSLGGGTDPSPRSIVNSVLVYIAVMLLVLLPLCPCCRCDEERDYRDTKRYIKKRKADILEDVITKPAQEHGTDKNGNEIEAEKEASTHETFEIGDLEDDKEVGAVAGKEKVTIGVDIGSPSNDAIVSSLCATEVMTDDDGTTLSLSHHSFATTSTAGGGVLCSICLEPFRSGEEVSWSRNTVCLHCYHRECITQWLLKHDECPVCRSDYLFDNWKYDQLPPPEPLLWILLRRPPAQCTCQQVEDDTTDKRTDCVFCVTHGLESPSGVSISEGEVPDVLCKLPSIDEKDGGELEDVDLEAGGGGKGGPKSGRTNTCSEPAAANTKAIEELKKKCPVHGRRRRPPRHRNAPQNYDDSDSSHWYEDRLRDTWWAMSSRHLGMRIEDSPSYAARSQFT